MCIKVMNRFLSLVNNKMQINVMMSLHTNQQGYNQNARQNEVLRKMWPLECSTLLIGL